MWTYSSLVRCVEKHDKLLKFCMMLVALITTLFCVSLTFNRFPGLVNVSVTRSCKDCDISHIFNNQSNEFSIRLTNLFVSYEYKYGNVTIDNLCPSHSRMETWTCFNNSFGSSGSAKLYLFKDDNPVLNIRFPVKVNEIIVVDNVKYKFTLPKQSRVDQVVTIANLIAWGSFTAYIVIFLAGLILMSFKLEGRNFFDKFCGRYTNYQDDDDSLLLKQAKLKCFNERIVLQDGYPDKEVLPFIPPLKKLIATALTEEEEILSYEIHTIDLSHKQQLFISFFAILQVFPFAIFAIFILLNFGGTLFFVVSSAIFLPMVVVFCIFPVPPSKAHYVLTEFQFIVAEEYFTMQRITCINLNDISKLRASSKHDDNIDLFVELTDGKSGLLAVVTDPQYYIDTVTQIQDKNAPESDQTNELV